MTNSDCGSAQACKRKTSGLKLSGQVAALCDHHHHHHRRRRRHRYPRRRRDNADVFTTLKSSWVRRASIA
eukprot:6183558-Pleurochrysis_carterae.AAC.3